MPLLMKPAALWGVLAAVVLMAIYLFRRQAKEIEVSSLMFFARFRHNAEGGRRLAKPQTPLILLLEILILSLLVVAAANPKAVTGEKLVPVVIILDDSLSMSVGDSVSPRNEAIKYLQTKILSRSECRFTLVRAGVQIDILGRHDMIGAEALDALADWLCLSPSADLVKAAAYAVENFSADHGYLVISDREYGQAADPRFHWLSFGRKLDNLAITAANRYSLGSQDRCFFAFTSFASGPTALNAEIILPETGEVIERVEAVLRPGESRRIRVTLKNQQLAVQARILNDRVEFDNQAWLLPVALPPVQVETRLNSEFLKQNVVRALSASGVAITASASSQLIICDQPVTDLPELAWQMVFHVASQPAAFTGNVAVDKSHPLSAGLPAARAAWAIDPEYSPPGRPIMSVKTMPLLSVSGAPEQNLSLFFNFSPAWSDLHKTPLWPALFWNLLTWRQSYNDGPDAFNYRSGREITLTLPRSVETARLFDNDGRLLANASVRGRRVAFSALAPGLYEVKAGTFAWKLAVNLCSTSESDLRSARSRVPPFLPLPESSMQQFAEVRWWFILPALILICLHQYLLSRRPADVFF